ncbi:MAG: hypothetical protein Q8M22_21165 [Actinomycetota bacterium]|nr:hypothetical protein [Actinomycetota bacterium]
MPVGLWRLLVSGVLCVGVVGCGTEPTDDAAATPDSLASASQTSNAIPEGAEPVLTVGQFDWFHPALWLPRDLHRVVLYPDGTLIRIEIPTSTRLAMFTTSLPPEIVAALLELADRAGLGDGVALPAEPSPHEVVDGGWTIVTRRSDRGIGQVIADQLGTEGIPAASERRTALAELLQLIPMRDESWLEVPIERWAIQSGPPLRELTSTAWPWPDLDPDNLVWTVDDAGLRCAIVTDPDWPFTANEGPSQEPTTLLYRRPLLPHEVTCDVVLAWRDALALGLELTVAPTP